MIALLALVLALLAPALAQAQFPAQGYVMTPIGVTCAQAFSQPVTNQIVCFQASQETLYTWNGSAWVPLTSGGGPGGGVTSVNGITGAVNIIGTTNEVIVTPGGSGGTGGGGVGGSGTPNTLAKWITGNTLGNAALTDTGSQINLGLKLGLYGNVAPANGQLLIGDAAAGLWQPATLTAGQGIAITNAAGAITIAGSGGIPSVFYDVRNYGALGDGVHNDGPAFQAAAAAAQAAGGGVIYARTGVYLFTTDITVQLANTSMLLGDGMGRTVLRYAPGLNAQGPMLQDSPTTAWAGSGYRDVRFVGFTIDAQGTGQAVNTTKGLLALLGVSPTISSVEFANYKAIAVVINDAAHPLITDCRFAGNFSYDATAFYSQGINAGTAHSTDLRIQRSVFSNHAAAALVVQHATIIGNHFLQNGWGEAYAFGLQGWHVLAFGNPGAGDVRPSIVSGNRFETATGPSGAPRRGYGLQIGGGPVIVVGNTFRELAVGIHLGLEFTDSSTTTRGYAIVGNQIWNTQTGPAISIDTSAQPQGLSEITIANNVVADVGTPVTTTGIAITRGASGGPIDNVRITGNVVRPIASGLPITGLSLLGPTRYIEQDGMISYAQYAFASLPAFPENGAVTYCTNCSIAATCAATGGGAIAKRIAGGWVCN